MGKFQKGKSGNPAGRPKSRTNPVLESIKKAFGGEPGYWNHVAKAAKGGDQNCLNLLAARVAEAMIRLDEEWLADYLLAAIMVFENCDTPDKGHPSHEVGYGR